MKLQYAECNNSYQNRWQQTLQWPKLYQYIYHTSFLCSSYSVNRKIDLCQALVKPEPYVVLGLCPLNRLAMKMVGSYHFLSGQSDGVNVASLSVTGTFIPVVSGTLLVTVHPATKPLLSEHWASVKPANLVLWSSSSRFLYMLLHAWRIVVELHLTSSYSFLTFMHLWKRRLCLTCPVLHSLTMNINSSE